MTGYTDGPPTQIRVGGDIIVGVHGGFALLAALVHHQTTGRGAHMDLSSIEAQSNLIGDSILEYIANGNVPHRREPRAPGCAPQLLSLPGGRPVGGIAVRTDQWQGLVEAVGSPRPAWPPIHDSRPRGAGPRTPRKSSSRWRPGRGAGSRRGHAPVAGGRCPGRPVVPGTRPLRRSPCRQPRPLVTVPGRGTSGRSSASAAGSPPRPSPSAGRPGHG